MSNEIKLDPIGYSIRINFKNGGAHGFWEQNMDKALKEIKEYSERSKQTITSVIIQRNKYSNRMNV